MRPLSAVILLSLALAATASRADLLEQSRKLELLTLKVPDNLNFSRTLKGKSFQVSYEPEPARVSVPLREMHSWRFAVLDRDGRPVRKAKLSLEATMPQHAHPMASLPSVKEVSPGIYRASGVKFHMPGWWVVNVLVRAKGREETFSFHLMLEQPGTVSSAWTDSQKQLLKDLWIGSLRELQASDFPSNSVAMNPDAQEFGRMLFHDVSLSKDGKHACATCHLPERGMAGPHPVDVLGQGPRKAPSILGAAWQSWFFWDGRKDSLWSQALGPIENPNEIGTPREKWKKLVAKKYKTEYTRVFGRIPPDTKQGINQFFVNTGKAIAAFETTLRPMPSPFDRYVERVLGLTPVAGPSPGPGSAPVVPGVELDECAITGIKVFIGKGRCVNCHNGPRLENGSFHATGVIPLGPEDNPGGRVKGIEVASKDPFNCRGRYGAKAKDQACSELDHALRGSPLIGNAYKTPTLRNVALTAPYMHNGRIASLDEVVDHYARAVAPPGGSELLPLALSSEERVGLICFMKSLTSER